MLVTSLALVAAHILASAISPTTLDRPGYASLPLQKCEPSKLPCVTMTIDGHKLTMLVDTGSNLTLVHRAVADKLGIVPKGDEPINFGGHGIRVGAGRVYRYSVGKTVGGCLQVCVGDLREAAGVPQIGRMQFDGVLGQDFLQAHGAVIDCANRTLALRPPGQTAMAKLAGRWACVAGVPGNGDPFPEEARAACTLAFAGDTLRMRTRFEDTTTFYTVDATVAPPRVLTYDRPNISIGDRGVHARLLTYRLEGDRLTVCLQYAGSEPVPYEAMPADFKPAKNFMILYFVRQPAVTSLHPARPAPGP